ncbi:MAG: glycosyl transferase family 2 [Candidatus Saccharibacteria bacterium]|jgi:cellulose synthase/poly-beta-1,6-N-acetylglucosamine synthase-like glycosyltransferase|nr:glycosyl transferase family 2 [Candidatus Saccharibacteria bacterium]
MFTSASKPALTKSQRLAFWCILSVAMLLVIIFGSWWFHPERVPQNFAGWFHLGDYLLYLLLTYIVWHQIAMDLLTWSISAKVKKEETPEPQPGLRVAFITTFVPGKEPLAMLEKTLTGMLKADYPHDTWLLDEGNDPGARAVCERLGVKHFSRAGRSMYNTDEGRFAAKTKGGNHNSWYHTFGQHYDFVAQIDTDFIPHRNFLTCTLGHFRDPSIAFVGTPQVYGNLSDSIVSKGAAQQTYSFYGPILRGFSGHKSTLLIGANHVVRVSAMGSIGYYRAHLTEDLLTSMVLHSHKWKSVYVPEILARGEGPSTWDAFFNQQMRWAFGCIDILFKESRKLLRKMNRSQAIHYFLLQQHYFNGLALAIANVLLTLYFVFGISSIAMAFESLLILYLPLILWQLFFSVWLQRLNIDPKLERGLLLPGKFVTLAAWPIYFLAFVGVLRGKRMTFKVTPKGLSRPYLTPFSNFLPHAVIGTITAADIAISFVTGHQAPMMIAWAVLNSLLMYSVIATAAWHRLQHYVSNLSFRRSARSSAPAQAS